MRQPTWFKASLLAVSLAALGSLTACKDEPPAVDPKTADVLTMQFDKVTKINGKTFGTFYYVTIPGGYPGGEEALRRDCEFVFKKVSDAISTYDPNSELSRFNALQEVGRSFPISSFLGSVMEDVYRQARRIDGAMDPTVGPLVNLWGFGPKGEIVHSPSSEQIAEAKSHVGLDKFQLRRAGATSFLVKQDPEVYLDLSTIGEGLAADELADLFDQMGLQNYMIAVAGAIRSKGANPDGKLWRVGIEDPVSQGQKVFAAVCPQDMAISTAGSYRNFFLDQDTGSFYSHIIDPSSGSPITHRTVSVSVIDREALVTDALDTGLLVMGAKAAVDWGNTNDVPVYAIEIDQDGKEVATYSRTFEPYLKCMVMPGFSPSTQNSPNEENAATEVPDNG